MKSLAQTVTLLTLCVALGLATSVSFAQESGDADEDEVDSSLMLNQITVTAEIREEAATDVPVSLVAITGDFLKEANIYKVEELQFYVPNLTTTETGISTQMFVRGIGTGNNQAFEQSVGQYIDNVFYGRQQLIRAPFFDLERVEVLRGPQNILFGKNSIAGAISYTTARPTQDFRAYASVQYEPDFGRLETNAMVSGGLSETFAARVAVRKLNEDGFVRNTFLNRDEPERDDLAWRASFDWQPTENLDIFFKYESNQFEGVGRQIEIVEDGVALADGPIPGLNFGQILGLLGHPGAITETDLNFKRQRDDTEFSNNDVDNMTLIANYDLNGYTLTSVTANLKYTFTDECDCDYVAAPVFNARINESYDQWSQELRIVSPLGGTFDWIGGLYFQTNEQRFNDDIIIPTNSVLGLLAGGQLAPMLGTSASRDYRNDKDLWSAFFQGTFHFGAFRLVAGTRYSSEDTTASRVLNILDYATTGGITTNPIAPILYTAAFGIQNEQFGPGHSLFGKRSENQFSPALKLEYDWNNNVLLYGSWTTGFKAGGFDARANNTGSWEFEDEKSTSWELGYKTRFESGRGEMSVALYRTDYDNLQISQFDGVLGFNVGNAKKTRVQGVEIDGRYLLAEGFTLNYSGAYLDHEFLDFRNGNCYNRQVPDGDMGPQGNQLCDYTGKSGQYTPKFAGNVGLDYVRPLNALNNFNLRITGNASYSSSQNVDVNLNPKYEIDPYTVFDLRLALEGLHWTVALYGKNLSNEKIITYAGNVPLSGGTFGTDTFYGFVARPRTWGVQVIYNY